jgi:hypothetical protein
MAQRQAKFCTDLDKVRWSLLEGVITRKTVDDAPDGGQRLPVRQVTAVEKRPVERVHRSPLAWPVSLFGLAVFTISGGLAAKIGWLGASPGLLIGLLLLLWGAKRIPTKREVVEAHQIVAPGCKPEEWTVVGAVPEVLGFVEGVRAELKEKEQQSEQAVGP